MMECISWNKKADVNEKLHHGDSINAGFKSDLHTEEG